MRLEKNWVHFAKKMIENVSRETYVRPLRIKRFFNLLPVSCWHTLLPFIPLFPRTFIFRRAESRPKVSSYYALGPYASKAGAGQNMAAWCM